MQSRGSRQRRHRERHGAESDRRRHYPEWYVGRPEKTLRHRNEDENRDEEANATIGHDCPSQDHGDHSATCPKLLGHEARDDFDRAAILHELAEQGAEKKQGKELRQELRPPSHEGLRPVREKRLTGGSGRDERCGGRQ